MIAAVVLAAVLVAGSSPRPTPTALPPPAEPAQAAGLMVAAHPETGLTRAAEELRKAELMLDAIGLEALVAASLTVIEDGMRVAGSFAYIEPIRRQRERGAVVKELRFEQPFVRVYGGSGIVTYRFDKAWVEHGARRRDQGWCTDVFERRDDGAWILVMRHRASDRATRPVR